MRASRRRGWMGSLAGALVGAGLFAGYLALRDDAGLAGVADNWDQIALAGMVGAVVAVAASWWVFLHHVQAVRQLASHLERSWKTPSRQPALANPEAEIVPLLGPVEAICAAYRQALNDRVALEDTVESLRTLLGQVESEKGLRLTVRGSGSSRNMVGRLTANLYWLTATPALQALLRCPVEELNARPFADFVHDEDRELLSRVFREARETGEAHNITFRMLPRGSGEQERHVNMDVLTRYSDDGHILHYRCFFQDISDRVRAERELRGRTLELSQTNNQLRQINEALERLKESYRDLYHRAPVMYFSLDASGHFVTFNDTLLDILGYRREDLWKQPYTRLLPVSWHSDWDSGRAAASGVAPAQPAADGPRPSHPLSREGEVESQWVKKDGSVIDVWVRSIPIEDEQGRFIRSRSAALNVTERNRLANELRARGDQLERANADLRLINRELEEFTSVVSHDLKEPLRTLQAFSNFLAEDFSGQLGPDGFGYINHLVQASQRLGTLIDDLLALSRAGRITPDPQTVDLNDIAATVRRDLADMIQRREAQLIVDGSLPTVIGDPQRITQLLSNLVGNGLKYNTSPRPVVTIGRGAAGNGPAPAANGAAPAGLANACAHVTIFVRDNGIGIDPRYHEQIFGIFRRLHKAEEYEGTGAGLAICKKIVEGHAGRIWLESEPGQGATFYFTLPAAPAAPPRQRAETAPASSPAEPTAFPAASTSEPSTSESLGHERAAPQTQAPHILLVEDMAEMALIVQKVSQPGGYRITWLKTAEEAWDWLQAERPRLLLLDLHLPGMSGGELCRNLRSLSHLADLPIALFTHGTMGLEEARDLGADTVLSKELLCQPDVWLSSLDDILHRDKLELPAKAALDCRFSAISLKSSDPLAPATAVGQDSNPASQRTA